MPNDSAVATREAPATFPAMLETYKQQIALALPKHINPDRMCRIALTSFRLNPILARCEPASVFAAVVILAQQGLEPGLNGRAYLVPYKKKDGTYECQAIPGWKGLVELANRTGRCTVWTGAVYPGDEFAFQLGDNPFVTHRPNPSTDDPEKMLYAYAIGRIKGNDIPVIEVWPQEKLKRHFRRYNKVGDRHYAHGNWEMYARKVPLLQVLKYMPASPELEAAMAMSQADGTAQGINIKDAIDGTFMPTYDADPPEPPAGGIDQINAKVTAPRPSAGGAAAKPADDRPPLALDGNAPPAVTFAQVAEAINKASTPEAIDAAKAMIASVADEQQRAELDVSARARAKQISAALDKAAQ